jgi:hypothetical protein
MPYWQIVTRSFEIAWRHRYLWLLALFAGESGGASLNFGQTQPFRTTTNGNPPDFYGAAQQVSSWLANNVGFILLVTALLAVLYIAFFVFAAACDGALVRASAEHDAERPFDLGVAWRCGVATLGPVIRLRLVVLVLALPVFIVLLALAISALGAFLGHNYGGGVALLFIAFFVLLASIPYAIYLSFLSRLGTRAAVLEQLKARPALGRANHLLRQRLGRVLLVWLLEIAVGIVVGIAVGIVLAVIAIPLFVAGVAAYAGGSGSLWVVIVLGVAVLLPVTLIVGAFLAAQDSTYWTLAFRRLELDQPPAYNYSYQPPPLPGPTQGIS